MKERPIIFSGEMVKALLAGTKTQTRRILNPQPYLGKPQGIRPTAKFWKWNCRETYFSWFAGGSMPMIELGCPFGVAGERLWVRETWTEVFHGVRQSEQHLLNKFLRSDVKDVLYKSDYSGHEGPHDWKWTPSIHMPRWASRITLEITNVIHSPQHCRSGELQTQYRLCVR